MPLIMRHCHLRPATWAMAFFVLAALGAYRLAAQVGAAPGADQPPPPVQEEAVPPPTPDQEQPEVLNRGPVHEAFAEPVDLQAQAGLVAPKPPPPQIEEVPPPERPQGQQFVWVPGYWSWDTDRNAYIWVSACWRVAPPRMSWVPGYWSPVPGGWEWVPGFWAPAGTREIEYLPTPPAVEDVEASDPAPSPDMIWVPPCMYWVQGQYVRRAGYWLAAQPNWVWVPSHYVVTPRGYVFAAGHWDYALERRGVLFAPVYFSASVYGRVGFSFSPSIVIDVGLLQTNLFACPRYSHYYFGDYYDAAYLRIGIYPWFECRRVRTWYDPVYEHDRWQHLRSEARWEANQRDEYDRRRLDKALRPARTYREQEARLAKIPAQQRRAYQMAAPLSAAAVQREAPLRFEHIDTAARQKIAKDATAVRTFRDQRTRWESSGAAPQNTQPPGGGHGTVTLPAERPETISAPKEHGGALTAPTDHREVTLPAAQREPTFVPPRAVKLSRPERVEIPASPVVGGSGSQGTFQRGPAGSPDYDNKDKDGQDDRKSRGDRDTRRDSDDRHGN